MSETPIQAHQLYQIIGELFVAKLLTERTCQTLQNHADQQAAEIARLNALNEPPRKDEPEP